MMGSKYCQRSPPPWSSTRGGPDGGPSAKLIVTAPAWAVFSVSISTPFLDSACFSVGLEDGADSVYVEVAVSKPQGGCSMVRIPESCAPVNAWPRFEAARLQAEAAL